MRPIVCTLWQNTGSVTTGNSNVVSTSLVKMGALDNTIDQQLTKMQPGDLTVELIDPDDSIWAFIQTQLAITNGLLPPWLQLTVGGVQKFLGTVDPSRLIRHLAADRHSIEIGAQDWSMELSTVYLGSPSAPLWFPGTYYALAAQVLSNGQLYSCTTPGTSTTLAPTGQTTFTDGGLVWSWVQPSWVRPVPRGTTHRNASTPMLGYCDIVNTWYGGGYNWIGFAGSPNQISKGDSLTWTSGPLTTAVGITFHVLDVVGYTSVGNSLPPLCYPPAGPATGVILDGSPWLGVPLPSPPSAAAALALNSAHYNTEMGNYFTRGTSSFTEVNYYTVATAAGVIPHIYTIQLDTVDRLFAQDVIKCQLGVQTDSWTVLSVDPELNQVNVKEEVKNLNVGDHIYYDTATNAEMVMVDARTVIQRAAYPYSVDFSRFVQTTLPVPVFGWISPESFNGGDSLLPVSDIEPSPTGTVRVISGLLDASNGSPDLGWTSEAKTTAPTWQAQHADWTNQRLTAPASLMPYTVKADSPFHKRRNRAYHDFTYQSVDNGPTPTAGLQSTWVDGWSSTIGPAIPLQIFYDYLPGTPRKIVVGAGGTGLTAYAWSGSSFDGGSALTWPTASHLTSICNFPGGPANALLATTSTNTLELALFSGTASCTIDSAVAYGVLVPTPYGPYIVGPSGYAKIVYSGGILSMVSASIQGQVSCLWPNTFVARSATEALVMGRLDIGGTNDTSPSATESWLFRLTMPPVPSSPLASIVLSEKFSEGSPIFAGAIADPSTPGRIIGHYGGRLWQHYTKAPWTVERFTPGGMTAQECIEHVCQLFNAIAVPQPSGVLAIVSRGITESPVALTVLQTANDQSLSWPNFFSIVRCSTQDGNTYWDAYGSQNGGNLLEISNQPMLWTFSQAVAMAENYASWFGKPRKTESQTWVFADADSTPSWEGLAPFAKVTVNGTGPWRVMSTSQDFVAGTCKAVLVEA